MMSGNPDLPSLPPGEQEEAQRPPDTCPTCGAPRHRLTPYEVIDVPEAEPPPPPVSAVRILLPSLLQYGGPALTSEQLSGLSPAEQRGYHLVQLLVQRGLGTGVRVAALRRTAQRRLLVELIIPVTLAQAREAERLWNEIVGPVPGTDGGTP